MVTFFVDLARSFRCAVRGLALASTGRNLRIMLAAGLAVVVLGVVLAVSATTWAILLVCIGGVLGAETMNTAIEQLADQVEHRYDHDIGNIKDLAAGAVLLGSVLSAIVGAVVLWPYVTA